MADHFPGKMDVVLWDLCWYNSIMVLDSPSSGSGSGVCFLFFFLFFSRIISWFFLVPAGVPVFGCLFFLRKGVLFYHDVLVFFGSGSDSGVCFPFFLIFFLIGMMFYSITISWFLVVPALVPVFTSLFF